MKKIEVVTHCQSIERPYYEALLTYQLSSFVLHPPTKCKLVVTVCCCPEDKATEKVLDFFFDKVNLNVIRLTPGRLGRRAIGRNIAAKTTDADIVWFTDVDYIFYKWCLDSLASLELDKVAALFYPNKSNIHAKAGMEAIQKVQGVPRIVDIQPHNFVARTHYKAIGGVQIVEGDFARRYGYCDKSVACQTPTPDGTFASCICDLHFRGICRMLGGQAGLDIKGIYRMWHPRRRYKDESQKKGVV